MVSAIPTVAYVLCMVSNVSYVVNSSELICGETSLVTNAFNGVARYPCLCCVRLRSS